MTAPAPTDDQGVPSPEIDPRVSAIMDSLNSKAKERHRNRQVATEAVEEAVNMLNEKNAVVRLDGDSAIASWDDPRDESAFSLYTFDAWTRSTPAFPVMVQGANGPKQVDLTKEWPRRRDARRYSGIGLYPEGAPDGVLNMWTGWGVAPGPGDCLGFKQFMLDVVCDGDDEAYRYLWRWMAHGVQFPHQVPRVAIVMIGKEGTGKGVFASTYGRIFGRHYTKISTREEITGPFNEHTANTLLLFSDETAWGGNRADMAELKSLITEPERAIRGKYKKTYYIANRMRFIFATNEMWAINVSAEARRFFVLNVSDRRMQDLDYFGRLLAEMESGGYEALMYDLLREDLTDFRPMQVPKTRALDQQKMLSLKLSDRAVDQWVIQSVAQGRIAGMAWPDTWLRTPNTHAMYGDYLEFCERTKKRYPEAEYEFVSSLVGLRILVNPQKFFDEKLREQGQNPPGGPMLCPYRRAVEIVEQRLGIPRSMIPNLVEVDRPEEY